MVIAQRLLQYAGRFRSQLAEFEAELFAAVAANPLINFWLRAEASGPLRFVWEGDEGFAQTETRSLTVGP